MRPGGEAKRIEPESHPRPVERATTCDADGGGENKLHVVNIAGDRNCVKPRLLDRRTRVACYSLVPRAGRINSFREQEDIPQGLKPRVLSVSCGTTKVVPFQCPFMQPVVVHVPGISVIVGATEVVAAMGANQLALVAGEAVRTGGADLAVVVDWRIFGGLDAGRASRTGL